MKKIILYLILSSLFVSVAQAQLIPRSVSADRRVKLVNYDPNNVVVVYGRYGYQTQVVFAPNETVQNVSLGDSLAWQAVPVGNNLFIKPVASSQTNMTVLTNINSYNFQLDSKNEAVTPTFKLQFKYLDGGFDSFGNSNAVGQFNPNDINWKYSFTGDRNLAPIEAYDNNKFTYLKFKDNGMSRLPAVFVVGENRQESLVNYHMEGDYLVIHTVAKQFTLRNGNVVTSVYNDYLIGDWKKYATQN